MSATNDNDMVTCPFDKAHKMLRRKLQQHIIKCREIHKDEIELLVCPFNKAHLIPEPEFYQHTKSCVDRRIIAHYQHNEAARLDEDTKHDVIKTEENWDDDEVNDYNPEAHAAKANIVRDPNGMFPAQRKAFIKEERQRLGDLSDDEKEVEQPAPTKSKAKKVTESVTRRHNPYERKQRPN